MNAPIGAIFRLIVYDVSGLNYGSDLARRQNVTTKRKFDESDSLELHVVLANSYYYDYNRYVLC